MGSYDRELDKKLKNILHDIKSVTVISIRIDVVFGISRLTSSVAV